MTTTYFEEAEQLVGWNSLSLQGMRQWAHEHKANPVAMKEASAAWHRNARFFALSWELDDRPDLSPDEQLSLIAIASVNKYDRPELLKDWRDKTLSYYAVRERVAALKASKPRAPQPKQEPQAVTDAESKSLDELVLAGNELAAFAWKVFETQSITDSIKGQAKELGGDWDYNIYRYAIEVDRRERPEKWIEDNPITDARAIMNSIVKDAPFGILAFERLQERAQAWLNENPPIDRP